MEKTIANHKNFLFKKNQIICLEYQSTRLYGETIQLIPERGMCWFRPICMTTTDFSKCQDYDNSKGFELIPLESASDLLWPAILFRPALDTEVISLLANLDGSEQSQENKVSERQSLNHFVRQVWAANQDVFLELNV